MLLRNLRPPKLCNGTRLRLTKLMKYVVEARIITGCGAGETVLIPRIPLIPTDYQFKWRRLQFPIRPCFAMTVNKSQGQTLQVAGLSLEEPCFSHGQLYVACSRVTEPSGLYIFAPEDTTSNVVYPEVLQ